MPRAALKAIGAGGSSHIDLVIGTNRDECALYTLMSDLMGEDVGPEPWAADATVRRSVLDQYERGCETSSRIEAETSMETDRVYRVPAIELAQAHVEAGGSARMYRFDWRSLAHGGRAGACHGLEGPFVFGETAVPLMRTLLEGAPPSLSSLMHDAWVGFASCGNPTGALEAWPTYDLRTRPTMLFDERSVVLEDPDRDLRLMWDRIRRAG